MAVQELIKYGLDPLFYEEPVKYESLWFEKIDFNEARLWTRQQIPNCFAICFAYYLFVVFGPAYMQNRKPYNLKNLLSIWNFLLAVFSILGALRIWPSFSAILLSSNGLQKVACGRPKLNEPIAFWTFAYILSKIAELVDTVFLILRKKPLSLLHWFHHMSMIPMTFLCLAEGETVAIWFAVINYTVHSLMYSYYCLKSLDFRIPKSVSMAITSIQILQFVGVLSMNAYSLVVQAQGEKCYRTFTSTSLVFCTGSIYLFLFSQLFYKSYIAPAKKRK